MGQPMQNVPVSLVAAAVAAADAWNAWRDAPTLPTFTENANQEVELEDKYNIAAALLVAEVNAWRS